MKSFHSPELTEKIIEKAKSLGADIAGIASVEALKASPSHRIYPKIGMNLQVQWQDAKDDIKPDPVAWPPDAVSAVVIGVAHNADEPELDWWGGKGTPGNRILIRINKKLSEWIENTFSVKTHNLPYHVEKGGIFLKDAAVMAGLGCIGKNNLVITPGYGPRIRFRALLLDRKAEANGPQDFNPCTDCEQPCRKACPLKAFQNTIYTADELDQSILPGINGTYDRVSCSVKMAENVEDAVTAMPVNDEEQQKVRQAIYEFNEFVTVKPKGNREPYFCVQYCRECELSCPVGNR